MARIDPRIHTQNDPEKGWSVDSTRAQCAARFEPPSCGNRTVAGCSWVSTCATNAGQCRWQHKVFHFVSNARWGHATHIEFCGPRCLADAACLRCPRRSRGEKGKKEGEKKKKKQTRGAEARGAEARVFSWRKVIRHNQNVTLNGGCGHFLGSIRPTVVLRTQSELDRGDTRLKQGHGRRAHIWHVIPLTSIVTGKT